MEALLTPAVVDALYAKFSLLSLAMARPFGVTALCTIFAWAHLNSGLLRGTDSLPIMDRAEALGLVKSDWRPILARVAGIVNHARSRTQLQIVLHVILQQCRITAGRRWPRYAHYRLIRKNIAGTSNRCDARLDDLGNLTMTDHANEQRVPNLAFGRWLLT